MSLCLKQIVNDHRQLISIQFNPFHNVQISELAFFQVFQLVVMCSKQFREPCSRMSEKTQIGNEYKLYHRIPEEFHRT